MKGASSRIGIGASFVRLLCLFLSAVLVLSALSSCKKEVTQRYCELGITLSEDFESYDSEGAFDAAYTDGELIVGITRLSFDAAVNDGVAATMTPLSFARYYLARTETKAEIKEHGYVPYCIYTLGGAGQSYDCLLSFYRTEYAYFVITFIASSPLSEELSEDVFGYIDTVFYKN